MVNRTNATVFEEDGPQLDTTESMWIVTYEFMFGVCGVYLLEALLVAYWLYPFVMKPEVHQLGRFETPIKMLLVSMCLTGVQGPMETLVDPRLGVLDLCPWYYVSTLGFGASGRVCIFLAFAFLASLLQEVVAQARSVGWEDKLKPIRRARTIQVCVALALTLSMLAAIPSLTEINCELYNAQMEGREPKEPDPGVALFAAWAVLAVVLFDMYFMVLSVGVYRRTQDLSELGENGRAWVRPLMKIMRPLATANLATMLLALFMFIVQNSPDIPHDIKAVIGCFYCTTLWTLTAFVRGNTIRVLTNTSLRNVEQGLSSYHSLVNSAKLGAILEDADDTHGSFLSSGIGACKGVRLSMFSTNALDKQYEPGFEIEAFPCLSPDFFISHSWSDNAEVKWQVLKEVAKKFEAVYGREPVFWLDKFCIDQRNIAQSLRYLPVFVAVCKQKLILHGETYFTRLWCCWELFVMRTTEPSLNNALFWSLQGRCSNQVAAELSIFDIRQCNCFVEADKTKIINIVNEMKGGVDSLNKALRDVVPTIDGKAQGPRSFTTTRRNSQVAPAVPPAVPPVDFPQD